jgi:hypothetical protein
MRPSPFFRKPDVVPAMRIMSDLAMGADDFAWPHHKVHIPDLTEQSSEPLLIGSEQNLDEDNGPVTQEKTFGAQKHLNIMSFGIDLDERHRLSPLEIQVEGRPPDSGGAGDGFLESRRKRGTGFNKSVTFIRHE